MLPSSAPTQRYTLPLLLGLLLIPGALHAGEGGEIPHFARQYGLECRHCHISPPKLNEVGEAFVRNNYRMEGLDERARSTLPLAVWVSYRADTPPLDAPTERRVRDYLNRVEVMSGGRVVAPWLAYFVEWRPVSLELRSDGSIRDRSGRFEDLFLVAEAGSMEVTVGQFRQVAQVDISRRLGVNEPRFFASSLPGGGEGSAREVSLRSFSLSGRAPGVRVGWIREVESLGGWEWTSYATLPFPGEFSLPLTSEARREASHELEFAPKGVFLESFVRRGMTSYGAHAFLDSRERYQAGAVVTGREGPWMWTGAAGGARWDGVFRGRWSGEAEWAPRHFAALGIRGEGEGGGAPAYVWYGNVHFPGTSYTLRLTVEQRLREGRGVTFVELGAVF